MISTQALRFNLDRGVSVLPGAEKLSEIEEDQATPLGPPVARVQVPAAPSMLSMANINKLWKAMIAPNSDMVQRDDGHWYGKPSEVVRPVRKEVLAQNTAIIEQIHPIIKNLSDCVEIKFRGDAADSLVDFHTGLGRKQLRTDARSSARSSPSSAMTTAASSAP